MNYLAHLYLSKHDNELLIGNFLGDSVKGSNFDKFRAGVQKGIILHRQIDTFTDNHLVFRKSKERLSKFSPYSGVITDMVYDHLLAKNWEHYSEKPLLEFTNEIYPILLADIDSYPEKAQLILPSMAKYNWLYHYKLIEGLKRSLEGISRRTVNNFQLAPALVTFEEKEQDFEEDFKEFFPELIAFVKENISFQFNRD